MLKSGVFGSLISALTSQGASSSMISSAVSALGSALNTVSSQVDSRLTQVASLCNNPAAYAAAAPALITQIEGISGLPPAVLPLLEKLRTSTDPLVIAQTIQAIESEVSAASSIL
jgi:hypothetical protein